MKIVFDEMEEKVLPNFQGGENTFYAHMYVDEHNKILKGRLPKGATIGLHRHVPTSETIFILSGEGKAVCEGQEEMLRAGDCHHCPKGAQHTLRNDNDEDLIFYAVVPKQ